MSAGKADGGISREPLVSHGLTQGAGASKFSPHDDPGSLAQSPYGRGKGKAGDLAILQQNSEQVVNSSGVKVSYMISGQKNIKVNAAQNISIKELIDQQKDKDPSRQGSQPFFHLAYEG